MRRTDILVAAILNDDRLAVGLWGDSLERAKADNRGVIHNGKSKGEHYTIIAKEIFAKDVDYAEAFKAKPSKYAGAVKNQIKLYVDRS